jgi:mono/diheme cytochrome c family protein
MRRIRTSFQTVLAGTALVAIFAGAATPASAQPATARTPNVEGTWVTPGGAMFFSFLHRISVGAAPTYTVGNIPMFHISGGFYDWLSVGALYATETVTVPGASQELELWAKQRFWDQEAGAPLSLSLKEAFNTSAMSPDAELTAARSFGALGLNLAARVLGNYRYAGSPRVAGALGASYQLTPYLAFAGDVAASPMRQAAEPLLAWGVGAQIAIPYSPHTVSLQVTNTGTESIHGASVPTNDIRYGFDFTVPLNNAQQWLDIFLPAPAQESAAPAAPASPAPAHNGEASPDLSPEAGSPQVASAPRFDARAFYAASCGSCHGAAGQGGFGGGLKAIEKKEDALIKTRIAKGSPKGMPAFGARLTADEMATLVDYIKGF